VKLLKPKLEGNQISLLESLLQDDYLDIYGLHALGYLLLKSGCKIEEKVKTEILKAIDSDDWDDEERIYHMENFRKAIVKNKGVPVDLQTESLYEVMMEPKKEGESNLVNKIPTKKKK
jgi:hypothetical protein